MSISSIILEHVEGPDRYIRLTRNEGYVQLDCRWPFDEDDVIVINNRFAHDAVDGMLESYSATGHGEASAITHNALSLTSEGAQIYLDFSNDGVGFMQRRFQKRIPSTALRDPRTRTSA